MSFRPYRDLQNCQNGMQKTKSCGRAPRTVLRTASPSKKGVQFTPDQLRAMFPQEY